MYRLIALLLVGCVESPTDVPFQGELVVYELDQLDGIIDLDVTGGVVRWTTNSTDGSQLHAARLDEAPILSRDIPSSGTTLANLLVDGDTVYVTDNFGVMAVTEDNTSQVIKDDFVSTLALDDHALLWGHVGFVSWLDPRPVDVGIPTISNVEDIVVAGDQIYVTTFTVRFNGLVYGSLYRIDKPTRELTLLSHAAAFADEFDGVSDEQVACGLYNVDGHVYWCVEGDRGLVGGPQQLLVEVTDGLPIVLPPQHASARFAEHAGTFYWTEDGALWSAVPGEEPQLRMSESGIGVIRTIDDGFLYGVRTSRLAPGTLEVRRVPLP